MVEEIYERYLEIEDPSREIEKVINVYLKYVYGGGGSEMAGYSYNNLAVNTFNYMIETDETLKVKPPHLEPPSPLRPQSPTQQTPPTTEARSTHLAHRQLPAPRVCPGRRR